MDINYDVIQRGLDSSADATGVWGPMVLSYVVGIATTMVVFSVLRKIVSLLKPNKIVSDDLAITIVSAAVGILVGGALLGYLL